MGFPSPGKDYEDDGIDLNKLIIGEHTSSTFFYKVKTDAMIGDGILPGSLAVIDRSLTARNNDILVATIDGSNILRRLQQNPDGNFLVASNPKFRKQRIETELNVWGVVAAIIHNPNNVKHVQLG